MTKKNMVLVMLCSVLVLNIVAGCSNREEAASSTIPVEATALSTAPAEVTPIYREKGFILTSDEIKENSIGKVTGVDGKIAVPRTSYDMYVNVDRQYYKFSMNLQEQFFPIEIKAVNDKVGNVSAGTKFAVMDTTGELREFAVKIKTSRRFDQYPDNCDRYTYNGWEFGLYKNGNSYGYYPLESGYYLEGDFLNSMYDMPEEACQAFIEAFSTSIKVERLDEAGENKIVLPDRFASYKLNSDFSLNLVNNEGLDFWLLTEKNQYYIQLWGSKGIVFRLLEEPENVTVEDFKNYALNNISDVEFQEYDYNGIKLEKIIYVGFETNNPMASFLIDIDDRAYYLELIAESISTEDELKTVLDYAFENIIIHTK